MNARRIVLASASLVTMALTAAPALGAIDRIDNEYRSPEVTVSPGQSGTDTESCDPHEKLVGGGALTGSGRMVLSASAPDPDHPRTWFARAYDTGTIDGIVRAEAFCARDARRDRVKEIILRQRTVSSANSTDPYHNFSQEAFAAASCGTRLDVGGGELTTGVDSLISQGWSDTASERYVTLWTALAVGNPPFDLTSYAYCVHSARHDHVRTIRLQTGEAVNVSPGSSSDAFARCRRDEQLVGGGALGTGTGAGSALLQVSAPDPDTPRQWFARAITDPSAPMQTIRAFAYCASG